MNYQIIYKSKKHEKVITVNSENSQIKIIIFYPSFSIKSLKQLKRVKYFMKTMQIRLKIY